MLKDDQHFSKDDWLCIYGAGEETAVAFGVKDKGEKGYEFLLKLDGCIHDSWKHGEKEPAKTGSAWWRSGDGTVPLRCALPKTLADVMTPKRFTRKDYDFWEWRDKVANNNKLLGLHANLLNMNVVPFEILSILKFGASEKCPVCELGLFNLSERKL